jgi:16S rRNA (adenine1518-N6/adenine1519-N6)-dimethyltransferase
VVRPIVHPSKTKEILEKYNIKLTKRLGQHFLVDENILKKEIEAAQLTSQDTVLEIGPGIGTITEELALKAKKVVAVELDRKFITILKETFRSYPNVDIVEGNALKLDLYSLLGAPDSYKFVSNLPYNIAAPVIVKVLEECTLIKFMIVMVQKEIAERMLAQTGEEDYGVFSLKVQYHADVEKISEVSRHVFLPPPRVDSTIVRLTRLRKPRVSVDNENSFFQLIQAIFQQRRKMVRAALVGAKDLPYSVSQIAAALRSLESGGFRVTSRAELLNLSDLALIYKTLQKSALT